MKSQPSAAPGETISNFVSVFEAMPGNAALLKLDFPRYTVLAVTAEYCQITGLSKNQLVGAGFFETFPASSLGKDFTGEENMRASIRQAIETKALHQLPVQPYDIPNNDGNFTEKYWTATNRPVLDETKKPIYLIHTAVDVSDNMEAVRQQDTLKGLKAVENLLMQVPAAIHIFKGEDLQVAMANEYTLNQWNRGPEVIGKPIAEALPETAGQGFDELLRNVMRSGNGYEFYEQPVILKRHGKEDTGYFNFSYRPFYEQDNAGPTGIIVVGTEVTEKVQAKKELAEKEQRLQLALKIANLGIYTIDVSSYTVACSEQVMKWFGLSREEVPITEIVSKVHPEYQSFVLQTFESSTISEANSYHDVTYRLTDPEGSLRHIRSIGKAQFENGKAVAIYGTLQDVTDQVLAKVSIEQTVRQRTEELSKAYGLLSDANSYLQKIINLFQEPLQVLEPIFKNGKIADFRFKLVNAAYAIYANTTPENLYGKRVSDFFPGYFQTDSFTRVANTYLKGNSDTWEIHYNEDGLDLYNVMSATKMDGDVVVHFTDVTKLKHLQIELVQKIAELERSNQNLEEFAHAASHDLKEPIRKIQVLTSRLKESLYNDLNVDEANLISRIDTACQRMGALVNDLLVYSHVSQKPHVKEEVHLNETINRVLEDMELHIQEKNATIFVKPLPVIQGYRRQVQQLFHNLISNALKYSKSEVAPFIEIMYSQAYIENNTYDLISVKDNGIGMEEKYAGTIFRMFARLHGKNEYGGTGVGLAIVKKAVEIHGGFIEVESTKGLGSVFKVYLPV